VAGGGAREGAGRPPGAKNHSTRERIEAATASGEPLPHEIMLERARTFFAKEMALRQAAETPNIDPELQRLYLDRANQMAHDGQVFARDAAPYYAPRLTAVRVGGDAASAPLKIELVSFKASDCLPVRHDTPKAGDE
jgi:hypothetical protein